MSLTRALDHLEPSCPIVFFTTSNGNNDTIYYLHIKSIDIHCECYIETALVTMKGIWMNTFDKQINCVFMIPMRGEVMDCTIEIEKNNNDKTIRTTAIVPFDADEINSIDNEVSEYKDLYDDNNGDDLIEYTVNKDEIKKDWDEWDDQQKNLFRQQVGGYYRIPFNNVDKNSKIIVSLQYNETLRVKKHHYYIDIPLTFDNTNFNENNINNYNDIVTITANVRHPSTANLRITSTSHFLEIIKLKTGQSVIVGQYKKIDPSSNKIIKNGSPMNNTHSETINTEFKDDYNISNGNSNIKPIGRNFELNMQIIADLVQAHRITQIYDEYDQKELDKNPNKKVPTTILISPQKKMAAFARSVIYLIDRSKEMTIIWPQILETMKYALEKLHPKDTFNIIVYDHTRVFFEKTKNLILATSENKTFALDWLESYKPQNGGSDTIYALNDAFEMLAKTPQGSFNALIFITHTAQDNEQNFAQQLTRNYETNQKYKNTRIWCIGIGPNINYYFLEYLSRLGRGKAIQLLNEKTLSQEMCDFLNEFRVPVMRQLSLNIEYYDILPETKATLNDIVFPYPIPDLYHNHPLLIKLDLPYTKYKNLKSISIAGIMATGDGNERIQLPTEYAGNDFLPSKFPMNLMFAKPQIDYYSAMAWYNERKYRKVDPYDNEPEQHYGVDGFNGNSNEETFKETKLKKYKGQANGLSDNFSLTNPWRGQITYQAKDKNEITSLTQSLLPATDKDELKKGKISQTEYVDRRTRSGGRRRRQNRRKNKKAALAAVALIGIAGIATLAFPFGKDGGAGGLFDNGAGGGDGGAGGDDTGGCCDGGADDSGGCDECCDDCIIL